MTLEDTTTLPAVELDPAPAAPAGPRLPRRLAFLGRVAAVPRILTWSGLVVIVVGFVLIAVAWGEVAGRTQVYLQLPYVMSAGIVGLGLVMVGLTVVAIDAKLADARARREQAEEMATRLQALLLATRGPR